MNAARVLDHTRQLADLLESCGEKRHSAWLKQSLPALTAGDQAAHEALRQRLQGGMGSITDLWLRPPFGASWTSEANARLQSLIESLDTELFPPDERPTL